MAKRDVEGLRKKVSQALGEEVHYVGTVVNILAKLGRDYARGTVQHHLVKEGVVLKDIGFRDSWRYGVDSSAKVYRQSEVWKYLQKLNREGKINLGAHRVERFEDLIRDLYHIPPKGRTKRALDAGADEEDDELARIAAYEAVLRLREE